MKRQVKNKRKKETRKQTNDHDAADDDDKIRRIITAVISLAPYGTD